jgi:ABC-type glucose/galactose transport system permease subunit
MLTIIHSIIISLTIPLTISFFVRSGTRLCTGRVVGTSIVVTSTVAIGITGLTRGWGSSATIPVMPTIIHGITISLAIPFAIPSLVRS